jgi:hypothetical protein
VSEIATLVRPDQETVRDWIDRALRSARGRLSRILRPASAPAALVPASVAWSVLPLWATCSSLLDPMPPSQDCWFGMR